MKISSIISNPAHIAGFDKFISDAGLTPVNYEGASNLIVCRIIEKFANNPELVYDDIWSYTPAQKEELIALFNAIHSMPKDDKREAIVFFVSKMLLGDNFQQVLQQVNQQNENGLIPGEIIFGDVTYNSSDKTDELYYVLLTNEHFRSWITMNPECYPFDISFDEADVNLRTNNPFVIENEIDALNIWVLFLNSLISDNPNVPIDELTDSYITSLMILYTEFVKEVTSDYQFDKSSDDYLGFISMDPSNGDYDNFAAVWKTLKDNEDVVVNMFKVAGYNVQTLDYNTDGTVWEFIVDDSLKTDLTKTESVDRAYLVYQEDEMLSVGVKIYGMIPEGFDDVSEDDESIGVKYFSLEPHESFEFQWVDIEPMHLDVVWGTDENDNLFANINVNNETVETYTYGSGEGNEPKKEEIETVDNTASVVLNKFREKVDFEVSRSGGDLTKIDGYLSAIGIYDNDPRIINIYYPTNEDLKYLNLIWNGFTTGKETLLEDTCYFGDLYFGIKNSGIFHATSVWVESDYKDSYESISTSTINDGEIHVSTTGEVSSRMEFETETFKTEDIYPKIVEIFQTTNSDNINDIDPDKFTNEELENKLSKWSKESIISWLKSNDPNGDYDESEEEIKFEDEISNSSTNNNVSELVQTAWEKLNELIPGANYVISSGVEKNVQNDDNGSVQEFLKNLLADEIKMIGDVYWIENMDTRDLRGASIFFNENNELVMDTGSLSLYSWNDDMDIIVVTYGMLEDRITLEGLNIHNIDGPDMLVNLSLNAIRSLFNLE